MEEEKTQYLTQMKLKTKEKRNSGLKSNHMKEQENFNHLTTPSLSNDRPFENRNYFKELQTLKEEKEMAKNRYQNNNAAGIFK